MQANRRFSTHLVSGHEAEAGKALGAEVRRQIEAGRAVLAPLVQILKGKPTDKSVDQARAEYIAVKARQEPPPALPSSDAAWSGPGSDGHI